MARKRKTVSAKVYLVPGFFGFTTLGDFDYFRFVATVLSEALAERGVDAEVHACPTQPTGSIPRRTKRLLNHVVETGGLSASDLHFVGHSTGGLDVRLLLTPGVRISDDRREAELTRRTRSAVSVATPHFGTPLASFFTTVQGRNLLLLIVALATSRPGRGAIFAGARLGSIITGMDDTLGLDATAFDEVARRILRYLSADETDPIWDYLRDVGSDQGAILQLTPESMDLFNSAVTDDPSVSYSCVVAAAPQPPTAYRLDDLLHPGRTTVAGLFTLLHTITARMHSHYPYPVLSSEAKKVVRGQLRRSLDNRTNDGIVPSASQVYGRVLRAVVADHLDVVGQYHREDESISDWLPSGSHFTERKFRSMWGDVADEIAARSTRPGC